MGFDSSVGYSAIIGDDKKEDSLLEGKSLGSYGVSKI